MTEPDLEITVEPAGTRLVRLTIGVPEERIQQGMRRAAARIAREVKFPGFRKGKAPYEMIVQRFGADELRRQAVADLTKEVYVEALEEKEIVPYAAGSLEEVEPEPLRLTFIVPLVPVVKLGKYRSLRIKPPKVRVKKEEIADVLEQLREEHAVLVPVEGRAAQVGDVVAISVEGRDDDGKLFLEHEVELMLDPEEERPAPGFHQALLGMAVDEERTFRLPAPESRPSDEIEFTVHLSRISERILPEIDDDLARTVGSYENLKELRASIEDVLRRRKEKEAEEEYVREVVERAVAKSKVEYPPQAVEDELEYLSEELEERVRRERRMSLADYLKVSGKTEEELREALRPKAEESLRRGLVILEVIRAEGLEIEDEEVERRIDDLSRAWDDREGEVWEQLQTEESRRALLGDLLLEKAVNRLVAIARGEVK